MKIIVFYHCPCLDGAFSLMTFVLFAKFALLNLYKEDFPLFFSKILAFSPQKPEKEEAKTEAEKVAKSEPEEEKEDLSEKSEDFLQLLTNQDFHADFQYYAIKPSIDHEPLKNLIKTLKTYTIPAETIIILLDYYGETLENIVILSQISSRLLIIDHHQSFLDLFPLNSEKPLNLHMKFALKQAAASLTYDFCLEVFGDILPKNMKKSLLSLQKYIEDHDLRLKKYAETDAIISALYTLVRDLNARTNPLLFFSLLKHDTAILQTLGLKTVEKKEKDVKKALLSKKKLKFALKEKIKENSCVNAFFCIIQDSGLINDLGEILAKESLEAGMDNLGVVLKRNADGYRVSLRGDNTCGESPCLAVAKALGGGGHKYSAGAWISKKKLNKCVI